MYWTTLSLSRFLSSYDSRFSIEEDLNRIQQSTASVDDTRVEYILAAVDSARKAFPCRLAQRKNDNQQGSDLNVMLSGSDVGNQVNGRLDKWREENIPDVNGFVEDKVSKIYHTLIKLTSLRSRVVVVVMKCSVRESAHAQSICDQAPFLSSVLTP